MRRAQSWTLLGWCLLAMTGAGAAESAPEQAGARKPAGEAQETKGEKKKEEAEPPEPLPPGLAFRMDRRVFDTTGLLGDNELQRIQMMLEEFQAQTQSTMAVVVLNRLSETGPTAHTDVSGKLLDQYKLVVQNSGQCVLFLIALKDGRVEIRLARGWGDEHRTSVQEIIDKVILPRLRTRDREGNTKPRELVPAVLNGIAELIPALYRKQAVAQPIFGPSVAQFVSKSWLWLLAGIHFLGFVYVLMTKESESWYLAGVCLGLPILLGMLYVVAQGEETAEGAGASRVWGTW